MMLFKSILGMLVFLALGSASAFYSSTTELSGVSAFFGFVSGAMFLSFCVFTAYTVCYIFDNYLEVK